MSTNRIREALSKLHRLMPVGSGCVPEALAEVEAIEKACRVLDDFGVVHSMRFDAPKEDNELDDAADFLSAIGRTEEET